MDTMFDYAHRAFFIGLEREQETWQEGNHIRESPKKKHHVSAPGPL
jgi:hypothetical protein